jgi:hypothetical protein
VPSTWVTVCETDSGFDAKAVTAGQAQKSQPRASSRSSSTDSTSTDISALSFALAPLVLCVIGRFRDALHAPIGAGVDEDHLDRISVRWIGLNWVALRLGSDIYAS